MPFVSPLALLGLLFIPLVVAMYLLKLRRDERIVPSTILWTRLVADVEANAPWQKLRRSLLFLLQLLLVALIALLAARPFLERPAGLAGDIVLVVDVSASMAATDVAPASEDRLAAARKAAVEALRDLPSGGKVSLVAAGRTARVVTNQTADVGRVRDAIGSLEVESAPGDLGDALRLASALAARVGDAEVLVVTDAALAEPPAVTVDAPVRVIRVGDERGRRNQAIVALAVRTVPSAVTRSVFVSVINTDLEPAERRIVLYGDGEPIEARDLFLDPQTRTDLSIDDIPRDVSVVEVRLAAKNGTGEAATDDPDELALDDRAWAIVPPDRLTRILLVSEGDPYLETALTYLPNAELYGVKPADYGSGTKPELFDLIIFEGFLPAELPAKPMLAIAPPKASPLGEVTGIIREPGIGSLDLAEPILRHVDLSTTHIGEARRLTLPDWGRTIIPGPSGAPLLYAGDRAGIRTAVLAFEPRHSDLPLQVAFPILISNLAGELLGGAGAPAEAISPGSPVTLPIPAGATAIAVERPDGSLRELVRGSADARSVVFSQTDLLGVYEGTPVGIEASPQPTAGASPPSPPSPANSPTSPPVDPNAPVRFAVDLFDVAESSIAPGSSAAIEALGTGTSGGSAPIDRPNARDELWAPLLLIVLAILLIEWAVYERDALARLRRGLAARLGRLGRLGRPGRGSA
ncbi:MAG TPA: VWA domain-containing protein [Candidatus Limnocylindrales bacterium]|nr:VWA domain-containing protein [Candidatus Limnocylindrales bacterium]